MDYEEEMRHYQEQFDKGICSQKRTLQPLDPNANEPKIDTIVSDILSQKRRQHQSKNIGANIKRKNQRTKWTPDLEELFFTLYEALKGDLDMIWDYFDTMTESRFTKKAIKKKYNLELKEHPEKLKISQKKRPNPHQENIHKLARYLSKDSAPSQDLEEIELLPPRLSKNQSETSLNSIDVRINNFKILTFNKEAKKMNEKRRIAGLQNKAT